MNHIIVALDGMEPDQAADLALTLKGWVRAFKVNDLFFRMGWSVVDMLAPFGQVFVDGKFHDIPNTVKNVLTPVKDKPGLALVTVHASGGRRMILAAAQAMPEKIAAVTVLTSLDDDDTKRMFRCCPEYLTVALAKEAEAGGARYLVCGGCELPALRDVPLWKIVPGIRPEWYQKTTDQRRIATPREAITAGAHCLVIGRPITEAPDPLAAVQMTNMEIEKG